MHKWEYFREVEGLWDRGEDADVVLVGGGIEFYDRLGNEVEYW